MSGLLSQNFAIVATPSLVLDGHFPDGNDGSAAIPLTWATVPDFLQKPEGTAFSVNVRTGYLTEAGSPNATMTLLSGTLPTGWSLSSAGLLAYNGTGQGSATIRVRATRLTQTSDSNPFTVESIAVIVSSDTQAPTIPTGIALVSQTASPGGTAVVKCDAPADVPTSLIPADGMKEVRWFQGGVFNGSVSALTAGLLLKFSKIDLSRPVKRYFRANSVAISEGQRSSAGGVPNKTSASTVGPCAPGVSTLTMRYRWRDLEPSQGTYTLNKITADVKSLGIDRVALGLAGVGLYAMIVTKDFSANISETFTASVGGATSATLNAASNTATADGTYGALFSNGESRIVTVVGAAVTWTGALAAGSVTTADFNPVSNNPLPNYLQGEADVFSSNTGGWQTRRWSSAYLNAWDLLMKEIGRQLDSNTWFAGVCTQETSTGGTSPPSANYSQQAYEDGLIAEHDSIQRWLPNSTHKMYINYMGGSHTTDVAHLQNVVAHAALDHTLVGGPDLVMNSGALTGRFVSIYSPYQAGTGYAPIAGPTFCSVQNAEWTGIAPSDNPLSRNLQTLWNYGQGSVADDNGNKPLRLSEWTVDWHTTVNSLGETFNGAATTIFAAHTSFDHYTARAAMTAGTVTQSGVDYSVISYGTGIGNTQDEWTAARAAVNGDFTLIAKLNAITGADTTGAIGGISIRDGTGTLDARVAHLVVTTSQIRSAKRTTFGGAMQYVTSVAGNFSSAKWLKLKRVGNVFTYFYSTDGKAWTALGTATITMSASVYAELFCSPAVNILTPVTAAFQQVNVQNLAECTHTFSGLAAGTYSFTAKGRDLSNNDSAASAALSVTIT